MGRTYDAIDERLQEFLARQPLFFVATAPLGPEGHVNISPKGMRGTFRVLGPTRVAYLDLTGSGIETVAHLRENGRITVMFCAFEGAPRIVRLWGTGAPVMAGEPGYDELVAGFPAHPGARAVIVVDVDRIGDSCGFAVPLMDYVADRDNLIDWALRKGDEGLEAYWRDRNAASIDGLPGHPGGGTSTGSDVASRATVA